jgi:putative transcriptional regulator
MAASVAPYARPESSEKSNAPRVRSLAPTTARRTRQVVADVAKLAVGREAYYTRELADNHEQYLSGHGESPGRWYGAGASALGLQGEALPAGFQRMFEGRHPDTGELLGRPHGRNAVPAFDVVLRPTKSVSILYGLGDAATGRAVLAAHHAGVSEATAYLDDHLGRAAATADMSMWTDRGCWRSGSTTAPAAKVTRCCTPISWPGPAVLAGQMTQGELADRIGVTRQTLNAIEQGKYSPSLEVAFKVARVFAVSLEQVFQYP